MVNDYLETEVIRSPTRQYWPKTWLIVNFDGDCVEYQEGRYKDDWWHMDRAIKSHVSEFWSVVEEAALGSTNTLYVVGWQMYRLVCAAKIYNAIKAGVFNVFAPREEGRTNYGRKTQDVLAGALVCGNPPTIIDGRFREGEPVKLLDLLNWGLRPEDFAGEERPATLDDAVQAIQDYLAMNHCLGMGGVRHTAASSGWYWFRSKSLDHKLTCWLHKQARPLERAAYIGARNEAYRLGKLPGKVYHLDVRSMYTALVRTLPVPVEFHGYVDEPADSTLDHYRDVGALIAECDIETDKPIVPVRRNGILFFPTGRFRAVLATPEYALSQHAGVLRKVHRAVFYRACWLFGKWTKLAFNSLALLDELGLPHLRHCLKLHVNAMYGKIGYRGSEWVDCDGESPMAEWGQWFEIDMRKEGMERRRAIGNLVQRLDETVESPYSIPAISAHINAAGRRQLYGLLGFAGKGNTFYCDTDSLMVNQTGYDRLERAGCIDSSVPGKLTIREVSEDVEIFGLKHYRFGERWTCAGLVPGTIRQGPKHMRGGKQESFDVSMFKFKAFSDEIISGRLDERKLYRHGVVNGDDTVSPHVLEEW